MSRRIYYRPNEGDTPLERVLMIEPQGQSEVFVYCPPQLALGPWVEGFESYEQALDLAALLATQIDQPTVLITRDKIDWWLNGLTLIGDADEAKAYHGES